MARFTQATRQECSSTLAEPTLVYRKLARRKRVFAQPRSRNNTAAMDARVRAVITCMQQSINQPLSSRILSKTVNLSPSRMRQLFKDAMGQSPMEHLKHLRMQRSEQLLTSTFLSVKEITVACGFGDVSHYVRDFKKTHGLTPSEFRVRLQSPQHHPLSD